jgi:hypothetical protein
MFPPICNTSSILTFVIAVTKFVTEMINSTDTTLYAVITFFLDKLNSGADILDYDLLECGTMLFGRSIPAYQRNLSNYVV